VEKMSERPIERRQFNEFDIFDKFIVIRKNIILLFIVSVLIFSITPPNNTVEHKKYTACCILSYRNYSNVSLSELRMASRSNGLGRILRDAGHVDIKINLNIDQNIFTFSLQENNEKMALLKLKVWMNSFLEYCKSTNILNKDYVPVFVDEPYVFKTKKSGMVKCPDSIVKMFIALCFGTMIVFFVDNYKRFKAFRRRKDDEELWGRR